MQIHVSLVVTGYTNKTAVTPYINKKRWENKKR